MNRRAPRKSVFLLTALLPQLLLIAFAALPSAANAEEVSNSDPWAVLGQLRTHLSSAPIELDFVQTFVPMGFASGDQENGTMALMLPTCIRWDYLEPFPKAFILCDETAYAWNPGETSGRRYQVAAEDQAILDLLRLGTVRLKESYSAVLEITSKKEIIISLIPKIRNDQITAARLVMPPAGDRLVELQYSDFDGNLTKFEMTNHRSLVAKGTFTPPSQITWLEN